MLSCGIPSGLSGHGIAVYLIGLLVSLGQSSASPLSITHITNKDFALTDAKVLAAKHTASLQLHVQLVAIERARVPKRNLLFFQGGPFSGPMTTQVG